MLSYAAHYCNYIIILPTATYADVVVKPILSLKHDQCPPFGIVLRPLHLPHQLEVGRDGGTAMARPLQVVEHHHIEGVRMVLGEGGRFVIVWKELANPINTWSTCSMSSL